MDAWDVTVADDGHGNALPDLPRRRDAGARRGRRPAQVTGAQALWRIGIPCFTAGTRVAVPGGAAAVERIRPGDLVVTRDDGPAAGPLGRGAAARAGRARRRPAAAARCGSRPGALGNARPLLVSPQHGLVLGWAAEERLVRARQLDADARRAGAGGRGARGP